MSKVVVELRALSTIASTLEGILQQLEELTWILEFCNVKIAGNRDMWHSHAEFKDPNASSAIVLTNQKTIMILADIARPMKRQILLILKLKKASHVYTFWNVPTVRVNIKQTPTYVCFGRIDSTENSTKRNILRLVKIGLNQFIQLWIANLNNDLQQSKDFLSECLKEFANCQYHPRDSIIVQYSFYLRTTMVHHLFDSKHYKLQRSLSWNALPF